MEPRKLKPGQTVQLRGGYLLKPVGSFEIVRIMPTEHGIRTYRIRSLADGRERVVAESELA